MVFAKPNIASANLQSTSLDNTLGQYFSGVGIDSLHRGTGDLHLLRALLLCQSFHINQADNLVFVKRHRDDPAIPFAWLEACTSRVRTHTPVFSGPWHPFTSFHLI